METISLQFGSGINNKARSESMPEGFVRSAINVDFDNSGNVRGRKRPQSVYSGTNMHSIWKRYFVEGGTLKYLNTDNTASIVKTGVGDEWLSYTEIASRTYYSNGVVSGCILNGDYSGWGLDRPYFQPTLTARSQGDMFAGDYQVAITWLRNGEESGAILGESITVPDGGGIVLSDFPSPPSDIDQVAVYLSTTDGASFYLYSEYASSVSEVFIGSGTSTIPLMTQFANKPEPFKIITGHYGRIYGAKGKFVYFSNPQNYGLFDPNNYWVFPDNVNSIVSVPGALYIGTEEKIYRINNIDGEGMPFRTVIKEYGTAFMRNYPYDPDNEIAYIQSSKGKVVVSSEGMSEITANNIAMDDYQSSVMTLIEDDGIKRLVAVNQTINEVSNLKAIL